MVNTKKNLFFIIGTSGSGKSTLEFDLMNHYKKDFYRIISNATRSKRDGEIEGVHYYFTDKDKFNEMRRKGEFLQVTPTFDNYYGTKKSEYTIDVKNLLFAIIPEQSLIVKDKLKELFPNYQTKIIYFNISKNKIKENMLQRGDSLKTIEKRLSQDTIASDFEKYNLKADLIINDEDLNDKLYQKVYDWISSIDME